MGFKTKASPQTSESQFRLRVGGFDRRKEAFKGWVDVESFVYRGSEGSFCVMKRDVVSGLPLVYPMRVDR